MPSDLKYPITSAIHFLRKAGVAFDVAMYRYEGTGDVARTAAAAIGASDDEVYKTLVFLIGNKPALVLMDAGGTVSTSKLARLAGASDKAQPCLPRDAERFTGYQVGGISPFGTRQIIPVYVDELATIQERIWVNGGSHGLMVQVAPADLIKCLSAVVADLRR